MLMPLVPRVALAAASGLCGGSMHAAEPRCRAAMAAYSRLDDECLRRATMDWFDTMVVGHNLCPFAAAVRSDLRVAVVPGGTPEVSAALTEELSLLLAVPPERDATTLLLLPGDPFVAFDALMEYLPSAQELADVASAPAPVQVVPFHPDAAFSDSARDAADFATRSPLPMLHLLRDSDVKTAEARWVAAHPEPLYIQERNAAYLRGLGWEKARALSEGCWSWGGDVG